MYHQDWIMRQIQMLTQMMARVFFDKDAIVYQMDDKNDLSRGDLLHKELLALLGQGEINRAENLLFEQMEIGNMTHLMVALDFYERLGALSDRELEASDFSRQEIKSALEEIAMAYGLDESVIKSL